MSDPDRIRDAPVMSHHYSHADKHGAFGNDGFGRKAEAFARFFGTPNFLIGQSLFVIAWIAVNAIGIVNRWDPYPFILLNLLFSTQAAYAAPLILLAQTRQADRDKAIEVANGKHREEVSAKQESMLQQNTDLTRQIHDLTVVIHTLLENTNPLEAKADG